MVQNMGSADRMIRIIVAALLFALYYNGMIFGIWAIIALILASVFVLTSFMAFCPLYLPFNINTCKTKKD